MLAYTVAAYAYDLAHLWRFFDVADLSWDQSACAATRT
jgi:hypothetical protein